MENKKVLGSFFVLVLSLLTFGWRSQNVEISSKDSSLSSSTSQSTTKEQSKKDYKAFYKSVFDDYQKILSTPKDTAKILDLYKNLNTTDRPIDSWALENAVYQADKMRYVYTDLNQDGVEELLIGVEQSSGGYFISGLYYLVNEKPVLLAEGFVAGHGCARNAMNIYQGGDILELSWSSGTGEGRGVLYHLNVISKLQVNYKNRISEFQGITVCTQILEKLKPKS